jgi:CRISPR-associated protein Cmr3
MSKPPKQHPKPNYNKLQRDKAKAGSRQPNAAKPPSAATLACPIVASTTPNQVVTLEPLAPLIIRSGRPFDAYVGVDDMRFSPPSTIAGCLRTAWARATGRPFGPNLAELAVVGPLLVRPDELGGLRRLAPKPADAHYFGQGDEARCIRAEPINFDQGCDADLPAGLLPLRLTEKIDGKASKGPAWWDWEDLIAFRQVKQPPSHQDLTQRGWSPPAGDRRTHVAIDPKTLAADSGRLFQTEGMDFAIDNPRLDKPDTPSLRLLVRCAEPLSEGLVSLGGERRLAQLQPESEAAWPVVPPNWFRRIVEAGGLTLTLLTPACFEKGYCPGWLDDNLEGTPPELPNLRLMAAAVERWQPHSGWDLAARQPRQTRKLVAAGATYWFRLLDTPPPDALAPLWLGSLCDLEQDRRDGYGLALPAPWNPPSA